MTADFHEIERQLWPDERPTYTAPARIFTDDERDEAFMGKAARWASKALQGRADTLAAMQVGDGKNHYLNKSAFVLLRFALAGHLDVQEVIDVMGTADGGGQHPQTRGTLRSAYDGALKHGPLDPPLNGESGEDFFEQVVRQARAGAAPAEPVSADVVTGEVSEDVAPSPTAAGEPVEHLKTPEQAAAELSALVRSRLPTLDWHALWADQSEEEWIVEPILPARRLVALYSAPKVGKSLLLLELCCAIATGRDVLGVSIDRPRRVLYIDFENDPKADVRERLQAMGYGPNDLERLHYLSFPTLAALDSDRGGQEVMAAATEYQCEVVVVDTVSRSIAGEENENDTWLNFYRHTGLRMKQAGISLIRLDHSGKDESKGQRGGSAKSGDVDAVWRLSRITDDSYRLDCEAARMPIAEKTLVLHREVAPLRHRVDAEGRAGAWRIKVDAAVACLDKLGLPDDTGSTTARTAVREAGVKARNDVIAEAIRRRAARSPIAGTAMIDNAVPD